MVRPDDEYGPASVVALSPILLQEAPLATRHPGVIVEHVGLQPRCPGEVEGLGRFGDPDGDHRSGGEVDLILLRGQRLEVLDVLFVSRPVEGDHDRSPRGPHAQPELASLGAGQVELGGLGSDLGHRLGLRACKHAVLLASMKNRTRAYYSLWRLLARAGRGQPLAPWTSDRRRWSLTHRCGSGAGLCDTFRYASMEMRTRQGLKGAP